MAALLKGMNVTSGNSMRLVMSSLLPNVEAYWAQLSASNPVTQSLEGQGTHAQLDAPKVAHYSYSQSRGSSFKPDI